MRVHVIERLRACIGLWPPAFGYQPSSIILQPSALGHRTSVGRAQVLVVMAVMSVMTVTLVRMTMR
jgi:hypothetical protein